MRYVPLNLLQTGMICGKKIIGRSGQLLLNQGTVLQRSYINRVRDLGLPGIYIQDELSDDIVVEDIVPAELRSHSVQVIKNLFTGITLHGPGAGDGFRQIGSLVDDMLNAIMEHQDIHLNMLNLKIFDDYTYFHCVNVGVMSMLLGTHLGLKRDELKRLGVSAILHDIGKVFVPKEILNKPGRLTEDEYNIIKTHSGEGYKYLCGRVELQPDVLKGVIDHHEKMNGTGYPSGKKEESISKFGKILSVVDVFDALTSDRPYRKALPSAEAIEYLAGGSGSDFDAEIVRVFLRCVVPYPPGITVQLSNQCRGIIVKNYAQACLRPVVRVFQQDGQDVTPYDLDLLHDPNCLNVTVLGTHWQ